MKWETIPLRQTNDKSKDFQWRPSCARNTLAFIIRSFVDEHAGL